ncbi:quercetin dioxygenase-like cupin family protein [Kribbella sp. VKM Ac-2571]|uniref:quercetin 2,3-dioxygenase n=1 Tax=Kribbella sp. VKM Ac-2571 TaxID=2512222 RepID=UPI00105CFEAB|nr:quercetin 2,3-dioxygenase [Kribbella sp. VKM Ac-2571]TDO55449.1 quercetin dioxygenase-like cupin family protein [Kribbella sp. VKM Ac-2571]
MTTLAATVRDHGEGERRWFSGGGLHTWLATSAETAGAFLLFEFVGEQGKVTPLHIHPASDETFYLLDGEIQLDLDGKKRNLSTGGVAVIPRGVPHAFRVVSPTTRFLTIQTPGTDEAFYRLASEPAPDGSRPIPVDFDRVRDAAEKTGAIQIVGPPPF